MKPLDTIQLTPSDWLGVTKEGLFRVNRTKYFNPNYYYLIPSNDTQKAIIDRITPKKPITKKAIKLKPASINLLDHELNQINNCRLLKNKLITYSSNLDKLRDYKLRSDKDQVIIKKRTISKAKKTIQKYLSQLRSDSSFKLERIDKSIIALIYTGKYANTRRVVNFG